jgi:hypothetical protein
VGDLTIAAYSFDHLNANSLATGDSLVEAQRVAENGLEFVGKARFGMVIDIIGAQLALIRTLKRRRSTPDEDAGTEEQEEGSEQQGAGEFVSQVWQLADQQGSDDLPDRETGCHCRNEWGRVTPGNLSCFLNGDHRGDHKGAAYQERGDNDRIQMMPKRGQGDPNRHEKVTGDPALAIPQALTRTRCKKR